MIQYKCSIQFRAWLLNKTVKFGLHFNLDAHVSRLPNTKQVLMFTLKCVVGVMFTTHLKWTLWGLLNGFFFLLLLSPGYMWRLNTPGKIVFCIFFYFTRYWHMSWVQLLKTAIWLVWVFQNSLFFFTLILFMSTVFQTCSFRFLHQG